MTTECYRWLRKHHILPYKIWAANGVCYVERFPQAATGIPEHESICGALFSLAHETVPAIVEHQRICLPQRFAMSRAKNARKDWFRPGSRVA